MSIKGLGVVSGGVAGCPGTIRESMASSRVKPITASLPAGVAASIRRSRSSSVRACDEEPWIPDKVWLSYAHTSELLESGPISPILTYEKPSRCAPHDLQIAGEQARRA